MLRSEKKKLRYLTGGESKPPGAWARVIGRPQPQASPTIKAHEKRKDLTVLGQRAAGLSRQVWHKARAITKVFVLSFTGSTFKIVNYANELVLGHSPQ